MTLKRILKQTSTIKKTNNRLVSLTDVGRVGEPSEIGGIIAFPCSLHGYWINGQAIDTSGSTNLEAEFHFYNLPFLISRLVLDTLQGGR